MTMQKAVDLIMKFLGDELTDADRIELQVWIGESEANRKAFDDLTNPTKLCGDLSEVLGHDIEAGWKKLEARLHGGIDHHPVPVK